MNSIFILVVSIFLSFVFTSGQKSQADSTIVTDVVMDIDEGIQYGYIMPFVDEWTDFWGNNSTFTLTPFQFWFKCIGNEVRGYFFSEDPRPVLHGKEAVVKNYPHLNKHIKLSADGVPIKSLTVWSSGGDFYFDIPPGTPSDHVIDIKMKGFKHYTRFKVSNCVKEKPVSAQRKYIMHIHLRDFSNLTAFRPSVIEGVANHMAYHRCALKLDKYEVAIQREHLKFYLQNKKIAHAVKEGWITFLIRNPVIPSPMQEKHGPSNCYYQAYVQNMAILQHWKENVKIYFWDSDEYMTITPGTTPEDVMQLVESGSAVGFKRRMAFCNSCDQKQSEMKTLSLSQSDLSLGFRQLRDPKLVVDPNRVGCLIVHWAGCGDKTVTLDLEKAYILHFEDLYQRRWTMKNRLKQPETALQPSLMQKTCDPTLYDWKGKLPSFHSLKKNEKD